MTTALRNCETIFTVSSPEISTSLFGQLLNCSLLWSRKRRHKRFIFKVGHSGPKPKKSRTKECANRRTVAVILQASQVMLKISHARLQRFTNQELPDWVWKSNPGLKLGLKKAEETRDQIANIRWTTEKAREFQINIYLCFINYAKAFDSVDHDKLWKALKEKRIPDRLSCLLRNPDVVKKQRLEPSMEQLVVQD